MLLVHPRLAGFLPVVLLSVLAPSLAPGQVECALPPGPDSLFHSVRHLMGTEAELFLYADDGAQAQELFEAAFAEMERVEEALSLYRPASELSRINREAGARAVTTDPEVFGLIREALEFSARSEGAFDITVGPLMRAWGFFRGRGRRPAENELEETRRTSGWEKVALNPESRSVRFLARGVELDMGGMGKGWALDRAGRVLREFGVEAALLSLGKSSYLALGAPPEAEGWLVTVTDPDASERVLSEVFLRDRSLSTSGSREKYFALDGRTYGHIIDPRTGMPATGGTIQVTVTGETAVRADMLSTALFVLGPRAGRDALAFEPGARGLFVVEAGTGPRTVPLEWPWTVYR